MSDDHYRRTVANDRETRFARCGYRDRFDPFRLSRITRVRAVYEDLFNDFLGETPCGRLLDAGCGTGLYFEALAPHAERIDAMDASPDMVSVARDFIDNRSLSHINPCVGSLEALPYPDNTFDAVVALDTLHHVSRVEPAIAEAARTLKPGGVFLVFEPNILNPLMFLAHLLPPEERLALSRNRPARLRSLLESSFDTLRWRGVPALITETRGLRRILLDTYLATCRLAPGTALYPRQAWLGQKRSFV